MNRGVQLAIIDLILADMTIRMVGANTQTWTDSSVWHLPMSIQQYGWSESTRTQKDASAIQRGEANE